MRTQCLNNNVLHCGMYSQKVVNTGFAPSKERQEQDFCMLMTISPFLYLNKMTVWGILDKHVQINSSTTPEGTPKSKHHFQAEKFPVYEHKLSSH